jgi:di/tricarboxylate transporter
MRSMGWEAWFVCLIVLALLYALAKELAAPDLLVMMALVAVVVVGEVQRVYVDHSLDQEIASGGTSSPQSPADRQKLLAARAPHLLPSMSIAVAEFGNTGLITVGALFVVVAGLVQTGATTVLTEPLLGRPQTLLSAQLRLLMPVTASSAFLNNTPIVAMFMPVVNDICKRANLSPSKLFLPMAYSATLGGVCTIIGTSTNIIVNDKLPEAQKFGLFDITWVGLPCAVAGVIYLIVFSRKLLPDRRPPISLSDDPRQYTVGMVVQADGPVVGKTVEQAGLRHLPGLFLVEIERGGDVLAAVGPSVRLQANDHLVFVGIVESVVDLRKMRGLVPATDQVFKLDAPAVQRKLIEAVVSGRCPLVGKSIREGRFRATYNAAVLAVARDGRRVAGKIGDIILETGDTLLLEAHADFVQQQRNSNDFYLVSHVENSAPPRHDRAGIAIAALGGMVLVAALGDGQYTLPAALAAAVVMVAFKCCSTAEARESIDLSVLLTIAGSLGLGKALEMSGAAKAISTSLIGVAGSSEWVQLAVIYLLTLVLTELITNNTAAVLMLPLALETVAQLHVSYKPFIIAVMVAASCGFATPFGYQTNLMVYGPGGYKFSDYVRIGVPLDLLMMLVCVLLAPLVFPFHP